MSAKANAFAVRPDWLAMHCEEPVDPQRPIVDAHHHLYDRAELTYLLPDYLADVRSGHNLAASIFVQARAMLRAAGPAELRAIGETEFVNGVAAISASGIYGPERVCSAIVGFADLTLGEAAGDLLDRHIHAAGGAAGARGRIAGMRQTLCWDRDATLLNAAYPTSRDMMESSAFRAGLRQLVDRDLAFDAWAFFPQLRDLARLARAVPALTMVVDHCGGILRIGPYAAQPDVYEQWAKGISELARCPNVFLKLSGLGMRLGGFGFDERQRPPTSTELAAAWKRWFDHCLQQFGPKRCMWGSNFPVDKGSYSFAVGLNAFQRLAAALSDEEKDALFSRTAASVYQLPLDQIPRLHLIPTANC